MAQSAKMSSIFLNNVAKTPIIVGRVADNDAQIAGATASWQLSDLILYDRVLTPLEVFEYGVYRKVVGAVGRWTLNGDLTDGSGNANHGAVDLQNSPRFLTLPG